MGYCIILQINIPAPVGMICAGLFLENVPNKGVNQAILIWGLKPSWSTEIRAAALAIIFLRSGLEIDLAVRLSQHSPGDGKHLVQQPAPEQLSARYLHNRVASSLGIVATVQTALFTAALIAAE